MPEVETKSAVHRAIHNPPRAVVKWLPPILVFIAVMTLILIHAIKVEDVLFENSEELMAVVVSLGLFFGGMWVLLSKGYPQSSSKYAVGAILLVCFHWMHDTVEPFLELFSRFFGGG